MSPTKLLASAAALFVAPAIFVLLASLLNQQGSLGVATLSGTAETVIWTFAGASLLSPLVIRRFLRPSERATQLLLILVVTVAASVFGLVLGFTSGRLVAVQSLSLVSMLAVLGWSWVFRECFRASSLECVTFRYTTILIVLGVVFLAFAFLRAALWANTAASPSGPASTGFAIFVDTVVGIAALGTAWLRRVQSAYARSASQVLSWALLPIPLLGTLTSLYWIFAVRKREQLPATAPAV